MGDFLTSVVENTPVAEGKAPLQRTASRPSFVVCPVCGVPAKGASYGIHDECATVGFMKNLAGDLIDLALGRRPVVQQPPPQQRRRAEERPHTPAPKQPARKREIVDAEFRVIDKREGK